MQPMSVVPTIPRHPMRQIIGRLDQHLSRSQNVRTFSSDPACILRYAIVPLPRSTQLSDGTALLCGTPIIDLHCWNERVPTMPAMGPDLAWAQAVARRLRLSLRLLVDAFARDSELDAAQACRANVNFVGRRCPTESVSRIIARMGFEDVHEGPRSPWKLCHDQMENLLIAALVWTHNPAALRRDKMLRERRPVYASRARLLQAYGTSDASASAKVRPATALAKAAPLD